MTGIYSLLHKKEAPQQQSLKYVEAFIGKTSLKEVVASEEVLTGLSCCSLSLISVQGLSSLRQFFYLTELFRGKVDVPLNRQSHWPMCGRQFGK